jgi:hypothetical protein
MAEENKDVSLEQPAPEVKELTPTELKAKEQGWVPQTEWDGDPDQWRPAKEFLDRGELFKKIDDQSRTIKEVRKALVDLQKHNSKLAEVEYKRALETLKQQKKDALLEGDADAVVDIDEKMDLVRDAQKAAAQAVPQVPADVQEQIHPVFNAWKERNSWYENNRAMRAFADRVGAEAAARGASVTDVLQIVDQEVKKEFAEKFVNPNRAKAPGVEGSTNKGGGKKDTFELTSDERRVAERFIRTVPGMTMEKYIADLKKIKGV